MPMNDDPAAQYPPDDASTVPVRIPSDKQQPPDASPPPGQVDEFPRTVMSNSPFAGIVRPATVDMLMQAERKQRWLLIAVVLGLGCIITGGCALLLVMLSMS